MGVLETIGSTVPNLMKDVPNFVNDIPRVPKCVPRWGINPQSLPYRFQNETWTIHIQMGDSKAMGSNVPNFVKDVPRVPKCVPRLGSAPNHFFMGSKMKS